VYRLLPRDGGHADEAFVSAVLELCSQAGREGDVAVGRCGSMGMRGSYARSSTMQRPAASSSRALGAAFGRRWRRIELAIRQMAHQRPRASSCASTTTSSSVWLIRTSSSLVSMTPSRRSRGRRLRIARGGFVHRHG
jgi:hypothetical protein